MEEIAIVREFKIMLLFFCANILKNLIAFTVHDCKLIFNCESFRDVRFAADRAEKRAAY